MCSHREADPRREFSVRDTGAVQRQGRRPCGYDKIFPDTGNATSSSSTTTEDVRQVLRLVDPCLVTAAFVRVREDRNPTRSPNRDAWNPVDAEAGTPRSATTTTRVRLLPRRRLPRLHRLRMNDYFGYFDYDGYFDYFLSDPKTMASESEVSSNPMCDPNPIPINHISIRIL